MRSGEEIWRQRAWVWVPALLFFLANAGGFSVYRLGYADRVQSLGGDLDTERARLEASKGRRQELALLVQRARASRAGMVQLYEDRFSTRKRRLTQVTAEVKQLARKAGLDPQSLSYPEEQIEAYGLVKRSFAFSVEGTYLELRRFLNLLELSDSFLTLEEATLSEGGREGPELRIDLRLSTLFAKVPGAAVVAPSAPPAAARPPARPPAAAKSPEGEA